VLIWGGGASYFWGGGGYVARLDLPEKVCWQERSVLCSAALDYAPNPNHTPKECSMLCSAALDYAPNGSWSMANASRLVKIANELFGMPVSVAIVQGP
jgi:hypothetical protein